MNDPGYDVLVAGGAGVDTIVLVDSPGVPEGDSAGASPVHDYVAHTGNGVAVGYHTLGMATEFIDLLGDDAQGRTVGECALSGAVAGAFACGSAGTHTEFADRATLRAAGERAPHGLLLRGGGAVSTVPSRSGAAAAERPVRDGPGRTRGGRATGVRTGRAEISRTRCARGRSGSP